MTVKKRRTRLLVSKRFQIKYITLILLFMFATAFITGYMVYVTTWLMFGEKLAAVYPQGLLMDIVKKVNMVLILRLVLISPLVILVGMVLSNRIAGPIYNIQRFLSRLAKGDIEHRLRLREGDELQDLAISVNQVVASLRAARAERLEYASEMRQILERMEAAVIGGDHDSERQIRDLRELRALAEKLGDRKINA